MILIRLNIYLALKKSFIISKEKTNKNIIIVQLYKLMIPIDDITHGAIIIYQSENNNSNQSNKTFNSETPAKHHFHNT